MSKDDQQEGFERILSSNLARAIDFIKYAEAKNAAILTFNSAWVLAQVNILSSPSSHVGYWAFTYPVSIGILIISTALSLFSFLPRTAVSYFSGTNHRPRNLLFVGDIENVLVPDLKSSLVTRYMPKGNDCYTQDYLDDICQQISINSCIAMRKFRSFNRAAALTLTSMTVLTAPYVISLIRFIVMRLTT